MYSVAHQVWVGCYLKREVLSVTIQNIANTDVLGQNPRTTVFTMLTKKQQYLEPLRCFLCAMYKIM